jgi:hypothetical protein
MYLDVFYCVTFAYFKTNILNQGSSRLRFRMYYILDPYARLAAPFSYMIV